MTPDDRRALARILDRLESDLALEAEHALYAARTAPELDRAYGGTGGAHVAAITARRAAELAHEVFALRALLPPEEDGR